jgi:hypothetical protein
MDRTLPRSLFLVLALAAGSARAAQPVVKSLAHDDGAHSSWADNAQDRWRKNLGAKKGGKTNRLVPLRTSGSTRVVIAPQRH